VFFTEMAAAIKLHQAGKARILAVATAQRSPLLPDVPTLIEAGLADFESGTFNAISAPPKTPAIVLKKLNEAIVEGLQADEMKSRLTSISMQPERLTPEQAKKFIAADLQRWTDLIKESGLVGTSN
jgi:tripartite-type tricarboxylate transporter receptor subunit TctC